MDDLYAASAAIGAGCVFLLWGLQCICPTTIDNPTERRASGVLLAAIGLALVLAGTVVPTPQATSARPVERSAGQSTPERTSIGDGVPRRL